MTSRKKSIVQYTIGVHLLEISIVTTEYDNLPCLYAKERNRTEKEEGHHFKCRGVSQHVEVEVELDMDFLLGDKDSKQTSNADDHGIKKRMYISFFTLKEVQAMFSESQHLAAVINTILNTFQQA